jgi:hypothetical protein
MPCSRFPGASLRARMPVGQCCAARPAGRRVRSGARLGQSPEPASEARVAGRDRTCGAPRFRRALYRLSYGHKRIFSAPGSLRPALAVGRACGSSQNRRGWPRTSDLLFVRQALVPTELLALAARHSGEHPLTSSSPQGFRGGASHFSREARNWTGRESNPRTTASFAASTNTARLLAELSAIRPTESGTRNRTSTSRVRAWRPAG